MVRASSPPDAALARGWRGSPALAPRRKVTWSAGPSPSTAIENRADGMASSCRVAWIWPAMRGAASRRAAATSASASASTVRAAADLLVEGDGPSLLGARWRPACRRASAAKASTSPRSSPYLRSSSWKQLPAGADPLQPLGVVLPGLHHGTELGGSGRTASAMAERSRDSKAASGARPARVRLASASRSSALASSMPDSDGQGLGGRACGGTTPRPADPPPPRAGRPPRASSMAAASISSSWYRSRSASLARCRASPPEPVRLLGQPAQP